MWICRKLLEETNVEQPKITTLPGFKMVGMAYKGKNQNGEISQLWDRLIPREAEIQDKSPNGWSYGVSANFDAATGEVEYIAGLDVHSTDNVPQGMMAYEVKANQYAVFPTTLKTIRQTFDYIYGEWLPQSGYQRGPGPDIELYDETFSGGDSTFYVYIPVTEVT
jgi:AraC family transcriptional regulator